MALAGSMHVQWKEWSEAVQEFNKLVGLKDLKHDAYARVGLANIQLYTAPVDDKRASLHAPETLGCHRGM